MEKTIRITSWKPGVKAVDLINLIKAIDDKGLASAKRRVDEFLNPNSTPIKLKIPDDYFKNIFEQLDEISVEIEEAP